MRGVTAAEWAKSIVSSDMDRALFEIGMLDVPSEVAEVADRLIATREAQRGAKLRTRAADESWRTASPVRQLRMQRNWTARDMARASGVSARTIWTAENRPETLASRSWQRIARALNMTTDALRLLAGV